MLCFVYFLININMNKKKSNMFLFIKKKYTYKYIKRFSTKILIMQLNPFSKIKKALDIDA